MNCLDYIKSLNYNYEKNNAKGVINFYYSGFLFSVKEPNEEEDGYIKYKNKLVSDTFFTKKIKENVSFKDHIENIIASA